MKAVRMVLPAEWEMYDAAAYYELQMPGLSQDFLAMTDGDLGMIRNFYKARVLPGFLFPKPEPGKPHTGIVPEILQNRFPPPKKH